MQKFKSMQGSRGHIHNLMPSALRSVGPFIFLDHIGPVEIRPGQPIVVPPHPHAGIETISYLYQGYGMHRDSLGFEQVLEPGRVNWMTAGSGIVHSEGTADFFSRKGGTIHGLQLWTYLSAADQQAPPSFQTFTGSDLPVIETENAVVRLLAGEWNRVNSPIKTRRNLLLADVQLRGNVPFNINIPQDFEAGVYVVAGTVKHNDTRYGFRELLFSPDAQALTLVPDGEARLLLMAGEPLREPMVSYGSFVMRSEDAIEQAMLHLQNQRSVS